MMAGGFSTSTTARTTRAHLSSRPHGREPADANSNVARAPAADSNSRAGLCSFTAAGQSRLAPAGRVRPRPRRLPERSDFSTKSEKPASSSQSHTITSPGADKCRRGRVVFKVGSNGQLAIKPRRPEKRTISTGDGLWRPNRPAAWVCCSWERCCFPAWAASASPARNWASSACRFPSAPTCKTKKKKSTGCRNVTTACRFWDRSPRAARCKRSIRQATTRSCGHWSGRIT